MPANDESGEKSNRSANPIDAHVGGQVRLRRMMMGMSQEWLGEQMGLTFQQIQKYEKGVNRIGASRLWVLAKVLKVSIDFFYEGLAVDGSGAALTGMAEQPSEKYVVEFLNSREGLELNRAFSKITDHKVRRSIVDLVRSLAGELPQLADPDKTGG
jgi:transcriptional regulator with XRE-family HTH domain